MHTSNSTLDLVLNVLDDLTVRAIWQGELFSDHYAVHFDITVEKGLVNSKVKQYYKFKSIELDVFKMTSGNFLQIRCRIRMT